jgi:hypothetical protein
VLQVFVPHRNIVPAQVVKFLFGSVVASPASQQFDKTVETPGADAHNA